MKPPIIVSEHGDLAFYDCVDDAELELEPIDVENDEYVVFDCGDLQGRSGDSHPWGSLRDTDLWSFFCPFLSVLQMIRAARAFARQTEGFRGHNAATSVVAQEQLT